MKIWQKAYDTGVPQNINPAEYSSINEVIEIGFTKFKNNPAFHNMGTTLTYAEIDLLKKTSSKCAQHLYQDWRQM